MRYLTSAVVVVILAATAALLIQSDRPPAPPPAGLVTVSVAGTARQLWPYLGTDLTSVPRDPVNLIFTGEGADPRAIRSALFSLTGDRTAFGFPRLPPFDCVWSDAIGDLQAAYSTAAGWTGTAIQLQCGDFRSIRFHLRLARAGDITIGGAHFEALITGTADHQALSWELAEQLVAADLTRSGLLTAAPAATIPMHASPFRDIVPVIYNSLPTVLKQLIDGPLGDVSTPVPIASDGRATVVTMAAPTTPAGNTSESFTLEYNQIIPRPFCSTSTKELLAVTGPVTFELTNQHLGTALESEFRATGTLSVVPVDPLSGRPLGVPYRAAVTQRQRTSVGDDRTSIEGLLQRRELPEGGGNGRLFERLAIDEGTTLYRRTVRCSKPRP